MSSISCRPLQHSPQSNRKFLAQKIEMSDSNMKKNIFATSSDHFEILDKGPKFTESGQIIKHSILGKPEWFLKLGNDLKSLHTDSQESNKQITVNSSRILNVSNNKRPYSAYQTFADRKEIEEKKRKNEIILSGEEVQAEILHIQARLSNKTKKQEGEHNTIKENIRRPISAGIYLSQNEKTLNGHKKVLEFWKRQEDILVKKVGRRKEGEGILEGEGERWRIKREIEDVLEVIKTNQEKLGEKCWEINLRKNDEHGNVNRKNIMRPYSAKAEIIRAPKRKYYGELPFTSFKSGDYLKQKIEIYKQKFTPLTEENPNLEIIGQNIVDLEINSIRKQLKNQTLKFHKILPDLSEKEIEETLKCDYNSFNLIKKTGSYVNVLKPDRKIPKL